MSASTPAPPTLGPIADLTYRNYDGPLRTRALRWWIVALSGMRVAIKRWYFWLFAAFAALPYFINALMVSLRDPARRVATMFNPTGAPVEETQRFAGEFLNTLYWQHYWLVALVLAVGASAIAADLRARALLVYLSKPITRLDYLVGKWMGLSLLIYAVSATPAIILYLYYFLTFNDNGFLKNEPWLLVQILASSAVPAFFHSGVMMGCSAVSRSGRIAGAAYAGIFVLTASISVVIGDAVFKGHVQKGVLERNISLQGIVGTLEQSIFGIVSKAPVFHREDGMQTLDIPSPDWRIMTAIAMGVVLLSLTLAWRKIRAIEVVSG